MAKLLLLHGPNLNLLGTREPEHYGSATLEDINNMMQSAASKQGHDLAHFQANGEDRLIERIHQAQLEQIDFIIINPAALTHTSLALQDALVAVGIPFIEVHLSNIYSREDFRHHSFLAAHAVGVISGFQAQSYALALDAANHYLTRGNH